MEKLSKHEMQQLFKATASNTDAYKELAAALKLPILQEVKLLSKMRELFSIELLPAGASATYPVADDFDIPVWVLPCLGGVAQNFIEGIGEEVTVPTFSMDAAADWKLAYAKHGRIDILSRSTKKMAEAFAAYEEESAWRVIVPAGTSDFSGMGLLNPRAAAISQVAAPSTGAGYLSKELINQMMVGMERNGKELNQLWISPEDAADIREWTDTQIDPVTRREIFTAAGMGKIFNIELVKVNHLGGRGKFNINGQASTRGVFQAGAGGVFNDYTITNPNIVDANGQVTTAGETQIWGFDTNSNDSLVMPIKDELSVFEDVTLHRQQKQGIYAWQNVGFACLDSRVLGMGVIDRSI